MVSETPSEILSVLWKRSQLLEILDRQPCRRPELVDEVDEARSTVYRGLEQLQEIGAVKVEGSVCTTTPFGSLLIEEYQHLTNVIEDTLNARPLLTESVYSFCDMGFVSGSSIYCASQRDPDRPRRVLRKALGDGERLSVAMPCVLSSCFRWITDLALNRNIPVTAIIEREIISIVENQHRDFVEAINSDKNSQLSVGEGLFDCPIFVVERPEPKVFVASVSTEGNFQGLICNSTSESVQRALEWIDGFNKDAQVYA